MDDGFNGSCFLISNLHFEDCSVCQDNHVAHRETIGLEGSDFQALKRTRPSQIFEVKAIYITDPIGGDLKGHW